MLRSINSEISSIAYAYLATQCRRSSIEEETACKYYNDNNGDSNKLVMIDNLQGRLIIREIVSKIKLKMRKRFALQQTYFSPPLLLLTSHERLIALRYALVMHQQQMLLLCPSSLLFQITYATFNFSLFAIRLPICAVQICLVCFSCMPACLQKSISILHEKLQIMRPIPKKYPRKFLNYCAISFLTFHARTQQKVAIA